MSLLGKLAVAVVGDTSGLTKSLTDAKGQVNAFNKDVNKSGATLQNVGRVMAATGAAIVGTLTAITVKTATYADDMDKMSQKTGVGVEAIQKLGYAAKVAGDVEMDALGKALGKFAKTAEDAATGGKKSEAAFKGIGVSATDVNGKMKGIDQLFLDVADKFSTMPDGIKKTSDAMELFGKSGATLIPVLNQGRDGIEQLMQEAQDLGVVIDENSIKSLAAFDDNMKRIKASMGGLTMQIAAAVAPAFEKISAAIVSLMKWFNQLNPGMRQALTIITAIAGAIGLLGGTFLILVPQIYATATAMAALDLSFAPFLIGGAVLAGIAALVTLLWNVKENARLAGLEINSMTSTSDLVKKEKLLEEDNKRLEREERVSKNALKGSKKKVNTKGKTKQEIFLERGENAIGGAEVMGVGYDTQQRVIDNSGKIAKNDAEIKGIKGELAKRRNNSSQNVCPYCGKKFKDYASLQAHINSSHMGGSGGGNKYSFSESLSDTQNKLTAIDEEAKAFGEDMDAVSEKTSTIKSFIVDAIQHGVSVNNPKLQEMIGLYNDLKDSAKSVSDLIDTSDAEEAYNGQAEVDAYLKKAADNQKNALDMAEDAALKLEEINGTAKPEWEKYAETLENMASKDGVLPETAKALRDAAAAWREYHKAQEDATWGEGINTGGGYERHVASPAEKTDTWSEEWLKDQVSTYDQAREYAFQTADDIESALGDGIYSAITGKWEGIGDAIKNVLQNILKDMSNMLASQIMRSFMSKFGNVISSIFGAGSGSAGGWVNDANGGHVEFRATGGPVSAFSPYLVGENGPELFVPKSSGDVVSNGNMGKMVPDIQINNINQTGVPTQSKVQSVQFDGEKYVVNVLQKAYANNTGGVRDMFNQRG